MYEELKIILWPDPRLKKQSQPVVEFDGKLAALAERMFELMRAAKGVGLAAPQVGQNVRIFIMNPTGDPKDDQVYVNPELTEAGGSEEAEEGCLSLPGINVNIVHGQCSDGMSDRVFPDKVQVRVDGHEFNGCGGL